MIKVLIFFLTMFEMAMAENPQPLDFEFISDKGSRIVLSKIISEKKVLASIFYTSCKTICPLTVQKLKASTQNLAGTSPPAVVMFTIDPKTDTSKRLMEFRGAHKIPNDWILLSGKGDGYLEALRALGFHFSSVESGAHAMHSVNIIMINPDGSTRSVSNKL